MNPRKEATYRMLSLIAAVIFVLPCVFLVFPIFDINPDDLWQMDSLMEFICAYKNKKGQPISLPAVTTKADGSLRPVVPDTPPDIVEKDWWNY